MVKRKITEIRYLYHIEVSHEPGEVDDFTLTFDVDRLFNNPDDAHEHYLKVREKYSGKEIKITKITTTTNYKKISPRHLHSLTDTIFGF